MKPIELRWDEVLDLYKQHFDAPSDSIIHAIAAKTDFDEPLWIVGYEVERVYGGPEEGGWWTNLFIPREDLRIRLPQETLERNDHDGIIRIRDYFHELWSERENHGNIYSVLGGMEIATFVEIGEPGQYAVTHVGHYE